MLVADCLLKEIWSDLPWPLVLGKGSLTVTSEAMSLLHQGSLARLDASHPTCHRRWHQT